MPLSSRLLLKFCLYIWKCICSLFGHVVRMSVKLVCNLLLCPFQLLHSKCVGFVEYCTGDEDPPVDNRSRNRKRSRGCKRAMPAKRKRSEKQATVPGKRGNKKVKAPLEFVGGNQSSDSGQTKLDDFFNPAKDKAKGMKGKGTGREKADRGDTKGQDAAGLAHGPTSTPTRNHGRANIPATGPAEKGDQLDSVDGSSANKLSSGKGTTPKLQRGQKQGAAPSTSSKMKATDLDSLPGTSGGFVNRDGSRVKKEEGIRSDDRGKSDHAISDTASDTSSDTQLVTPPVTPRKTTGSWTILGSFLSSPKRQQARTTSPSAWSARDTEAYRNRYPNKRDNKSLNDNWKFYNNEIESKPRGTYIDTMHVHWLGDYSLLEEHHGYIQWLFPIREMGMNWQAQELQLHEAERICKDPKCRDRVVKSYELMLHFWGMRLEDRRTGKIVREDNWKERFRNLNRSSHNYLRITRILKSLGELGHERLKLPFLKFVLHEAIVERTLANAERSCLHYWIHTLRDDKQRKWIQTYADNLLAESKH